MLAWPHGRITSEVLLVLRTEYDVSFHTAPSMQNGFPNWESITRFYFRSRHTILQHIHCFSFTFSFLIAIELNRLTSSTMFNRLADNKSVQILKAADEGGYGVPGVVSVSILFASGNFLC
jgi:hypothetical protein